MTEQGFEKMYVIIDDKFEIEKNIITEADVLNKIKSYEKKDTGSLNLIVYKNTKASGKSIAVVICNKMDCRILNYKSL